MGNTASSAALSSPVELQQEMLKGLNDPATRQKLVAISNDPHMAHMHWEGPPMDPLKQEVAALTRIALIADPGLQARYDQVVKEAKTRTPTAFWSAYVACVRAVLLDAASEKNAPPRPPVASVEPTSVVTPAIAIATIESKEAKSARESSKAQSPQASDSVPADDIEDEDDDGIDTVLFSHDECFVYKVPPRPGAAGWAAAAWGLDKPALENTHVRATAAGGDVTVAVWQRPSEGAPSAPAAPQRTTVATAPAAQGHRLIAACVIPASVKRRRVDMSGPSAAAPDLPPDGVHLASYLEPVLDSSRYFVARISRGPSGGKTGGPSSQTGLLGLGFRDREAASALKLAILDHLAFARRQAGSTAPSAVGGGFSSATGEADSADPNAAALEAALAGISLGGADGAPSGRISIDVGVFGRNKARVAAAGSVGTPLSPAATGGVATASPATSSPAKTSGRLLLPPPRKL